VDDPREIARALLKHIGAPPGAANVLIRGGATHPRLVVRLSPGLRIPQDRLPKTFRGLEVTYEPRHIARPFASTD
jgi:hypothetical protein